MLFFAYRQKSLNERVVKRRSATALDKERMKATINKAKTSNYGTPIGRGVPPREGGGAAKERGRIDKGPPRRRQSGADGCPLSDEANCRTCPQRGQELYEKRKRQQNRRRSPHKKRPLRSSPPF